MPRPSKLTPERQERIVAAVQAGAPLAGAAQRGGIAESTMTEWLAKGRAALVEADGDPELASESARAHARFASAVDGALRDWETFQIGLIQRAAQGQPWRKTRTRTYQDKDAGEVTEVVVEEGTTFSWQAAAWLLERRWPQTYARVTRTELTGQGGGPVEVGVAELEARALAAVDELAPRRRAG